MGNRRWTKEEDEIILEKYGKCNINTLAKSINRTPRAIHHRLQAIEGTMSCDAISGNIPTRDVAEIMGLNMCTIQRMAKKKIIPVVRPNRRYLIIEATFWKWLKNNLDKVNFNNIDDSVEFIVPTWYREEIKKHKRNFTKVNSGRHHKWTKFEETTAWNLFLKGYTNQEIAEKLERTLESVKNKLYLMKKNKLKKAS